MANGFHILAEDLKEAATFATERDEATVGMSWNERIDWLRPTAKYLRSELREIGAQLGRGAPGTGARLHIPLLAKLPDVREGGGVELL